MSERNQTIARLNAVRTAQRAVPTSS